MSRPPEIAFFPEASFGAALNCVGIAQAMQRQGANPVFICHAGFTGVFAEYGFKEYHLPDHPGSSAEAIADYWQDFINTHLPHFNLSPLAQLDTYVGPTWRAIVETAIAAEDDLARFWPKSGLTSSCWTTSSCFPLSPTQGARGCASCPAPRRKYPMPTCRPICPALRPARIAARSTWPMRMPPAMCIANITPFASGTDCRPCRPVFSLSRRRI